MMNEVHAYCVYDRKARVYNNPYFLINDAVAIRQFDQVVNDPESMLFKYPEDYILFRIGKFNMLTGSVGAETNPVEVTNALSQKREV